MIGRVTGVVATWTNKQRLQFVRRYHPQVCEKYNGPEGCHFGENCHFLHVCNEFILGTPHSRRCSLSHELSSAHSRRVLTHFMLSDVFIDEYRWLIIRCYACYAFRLLCCLQGISLPASMRHLLIREEAPPLGSTGVCKEQTGKRPIASQTP